MFELGKDLLDWVEVGGVFGEEEELGSGRTDELSYGFALVTAEIVHDYDVAGTKRRCKNLLDIDLKTLAIDRPIEKPRCLDPIVAERSDECRCIPVTVGRFDFDSFAAGAPSSQWRHIGLGPSLPSYARSLESYWPPLYSFGASLGTRLLRRSRLGLSLAIPLPQNLPYPRHGCRDLLILLRLGRCRATMNANWLPDRRTMRYIVDDEQAASAVCLLAKPGMAHLRQRRVRGNLATSSAAGLGVATTNDITGIASTADRIEQSGSTRVRPLHRVR